MPSAAFLPRAQVYLIDGDRLVEALPLLLCSRAIPRSFHSSFETSQTTEAVRGPQFRGEAVGVGLLDQVAAVPALHLVFVDLALAEIGNEELPDAGGAPVAHRVPAAVPVIEVADHADPLRVRCPDREMDALEPAVHLGGAHPAARSCDSAFLQPRR